MRHGLEATGEPVSIETSEFEALYSMMRFDRLSGFVGKALREGAVFTANPMIEEKLLASWHDELRASVELEAQLVRTADELDDGGIRWLLTKGAALAHADYADPATRTFGDIDLIVHPEDWESCLSLLGSSGYVRTEQQVSLHYESRFGKGATFASPQGHELDLHRRLAIGRFGVSSEMNMLFDTIGGLEIGGRQIPIMSRENRLLHACFHSVLGGSHGLRAFRDVAQLIVVGGADWNRTLSTAEAWRAEAVVATAIIETWRRLQLDLVHPAQIWANSFLISRADRIAIKTFLLERPFRNQVVTALPRLRPMDAARLIWELGFRRRSRLGQQGAAHAGPDDGSTWR